MFNTMMTQFNTPVPAWNYPGAPTGVSATNGDDQVSTVTFTAPGNLGLPTLTGYTVVSSPAGGVDSNAGSSSLSHLMTNLVNGTSYTFTVYATVNTGYQILNGPSSSASSAITPANNVIVFTSTGAQTWTVPANIYTLYSVEGIGGGGATVGQGGGGGGYAKSINFSVIPGQTIYLNVSTGDSNDTWVNISSNSPPSSSTNGILASAAYVFYGGGSPNTNSLIGNTTYIGGNGGSLLGYGGGGSAGPGGQGQNGGDGVLGSGGGGGGGCNGGSSTAGQGAISGGAGGGGGAGPTGTAGGGGGTSGSHNGGNGSNGSGGGGCYWTTGSTGGNGSTYVISNWGGSYGPGSGGGTGYPSSTAGNGGTYGGGGGYSLGISGKGIIVITY